MQKNSNKTASEKDQETFKNSNDVQNVQCISNSNQNPTSSKPKSNRILLSWKKIKDSTNEFLNSQTEIFKNLTTTIHNFEVNEEALKEQPDSRSMFERDKDLMTDFARRTSSSFIDKVYPPPSDEVRYRNSLFNGRRFF
jgi:hypothetical protein